MKYFEDLIFFLTQRLCKIAVRGWELTKRREY